MRQFQIRKSILFYFCIACCVSVYENDCSYDKSVFRFWSGFSSSTAFFFSPATALIWYLVVVMFTNTRTRPFYTGYQIMWQNFNDANFYTKYLFFIGLFFHFPIKFNESNWFGMQNNCCCFQLMYRFHFIESVVLRLFVGFRLHCNVPMSWLSLT